jgi:hypothetical protein
MRGELAPLLHFDPAGSFRPLLLVDVADVIGQTALADPRRAHARRELAGLSP